MAKNETTMHIDIPEMRLFNKIGAKLQQPDAIISIESIGNGYIVHNHFTGWKEYCAHRQELRDKLPLILKELPR